MTRGPFLLDTGFLVALVNRADPAHARCVGTWRSVQGPFVSTEGVLVEAAWLLRKTKTGFAQVTGLVQAVGTVFPPLTAARLKRCEGLMEKFADVPMDSTDALLVALAEEFDVRRVLTLDRRGFRVFRTAKGRALTQFP